MCITYNTSTTETTLFICYITHALEAPFLENMIIKQD